MVWMVAVALVLVGGATAAMAAGHGTMAGADVHPGQVLPEGDLSAADLRRVRFSTAARGYRPDEVDELLARVARQWEQQRQQG